MNMETKNNVMNNKFFEFLHAFGFGFPFLFGFTPVGFTQDVEANIILFYNCLPLTLA